MLKSLLSAKGVTKSNICRYSSFIVLAIISDKLDVRIDLIFDLCFHRRTSIHVDQAYLYGLCLEHAHHSIISSME